METFAFVDLVNSDGPIKVVAEISLLTEEEGGRASPIKATYRPNHNFGTEKTASFISGKLKFQGEMNFIPARLISYQLHSLMAPVLKRC